MRFGFRTFPILVAAGIVACLGSASAPVSAGMRAATRVARYDNAVIADTALRYVGKPGWTACADAGRSGLTGGPTPVQPQFDSSGKLVKEGDGQCRAFVNCIVWIASGHTQWLGGGANYFSSFLNPNGGPPGTEIKKVSQLIKGDIVQQGASASAPNLHTYIIVARAPRKTDTETTRTFTVVDSNHDYKETVLTYPRAITLGTNEHAFRMGAIPSSESNLVRARLSGNIRDALRVFGGQVLVPVVVPKAWGQTAASFTRPPDFCGKPPITRKPTKRHYLIAFVAPGTIHSCPATVGVLSASVEGRRPCPSWMTCNAFEIGGQSYDLNVGGDGGTAIAWRQCGVDYYLYDNSEAGLATLKRFLARLAPLSGKKCARG